MNANAKKWVAALRSGEFKQGKCVLRDAENNHCCLGVACELYRREHGGEWASVRDGFSFMSHSAITPFAVKEWLGLQDACGVYAYGALTCDNDDGKTFAEIADIIESEPEGLFTQESQDAEDLALAAKAAGGAL